MNIVQDHRRIGKSVRIGALTWRIADKIEEFGSEFACRCLEAERRFLNIGFHYPERMHDVACDVGLIGGTFISNDHSFIFAYVGLSVENDLPIFSTELMRLSRICRIGLTEIEAEEFTDWVFWREGEDPTGELPDLGRVIVLMADRREKARTHLREAQRLLRGQEHVMDNGHKNNGVYRVTKTASV